MKTTILVSRILLGLLFAVFGLNGFLHFIPMPPPQGVAGQYMGALFASGYLVPIFALQLFAGVLLLANRYVALGLAVLAPIIFNITLYHVLMDPKGLAGAVIAIALWSAVFYRERAVFSAFLQQKPALVKS